MKSSSSTTSIAIHNNSQNVQFLNNFQPIKLKSGQQSVCKLCLTQISQCQIFSSCNCKGSLGLVHQKCLIQWFQKRKDIQLIIENRYAVCQICKQNINVNVKWKCRCSNIQEVRESIFEHSYYSTIIFGLLMAILLISWILTHFILPTTSNYWMYWVISAGLTLIVYLMYHIIKFRRFISQVVKIKNVQNNRIQITDLICVNQYRANSKQ